MTRLKILALRLRIALLKSLISWTTDMLLAHNQLRDEARKTRERWYHQNQVMCMTDAREHQLRKMRSLTRRLEVLRSELQS